MPIPEEEKAVLYDAILSIQGGLRLLYHLVGTNVETEVLKENITNIQQHADKALAVVDARLTWGQWFVNHI
jgi:hypothetical protein